MDQACRAFGGYLNADQVHHGSVADVPRPSHRRCREGDRVERAPQVVTHNAHELSLELLLSPSRGGVVHCTHHAQRTALGVVGQVGAVDDVQPFAVAASEAVLVLPMVLSARDGMVHPGNDPFAILRVDEILPVRQLDALTLKSPDLPVEVQAPRLEVQVPDGIVRRKSGKPVALVGLFQRAQQ